MVHAENPAQGIEPQRANQRGAEEGVRRAFGFPGSRFLYRDVRISQARAMARSLPMAWSLHESGREPGRFYSGPVFASIPESHPREESTHETPAYDWPCTRSWLLCRAGLRRRALGDAQENKGNRRDRHRHPRLVDSVFVSGRQPEADRLYD